MVQTLSFSFLIGYDYLMNCKLSEMFSKERLPMAELPMAEITNSNSAKSGEDSFIIGYSIQKAIVKRDIGHAVQQLSQ